MKKRKKGIITIIILIFSILIIYCIFIKKFDYKIKNIGNNIIIKDNNIKEYFLNISSYKAIVEITIKSNKNTNRYLLEHEYNLDTIKQIVLEPSELKDSMIIRNGDNVEIISKENKVSKIYKDYQYINGDLLSLEGFIKDYLNDENTCIEEKDEFYNTYEVKIKRNNNYVKYKKIYIDNKNKLPKKIEISDINRNILIYIEYKEIKIN